MKSPRLGRIIAALETRSRRTTIRPSRPGGPPPQESYRVNRRIRVPEVRVIGPDGTQLGILPTHEALRIAEEEGLDLVEVSPRAVPPVCRIMDYGKFKFEEAKQKRQAKKRQTIIETKEVKFRPKTDEHDYEFKLRHIRRFLEEGNKVRMVVQFRGREIVHPQTGKAVLDRVLRDTADIAHLAQMPSLEGRQMAMVISPKPGHVRKKEEPPPSTPSSSSSSSSSPPSSSPSSSS